MSDRRKPETVCGREWPPEWIRNSGYGPLATRILTGFIVVGTGVVVAGFLWRMYVNDILLDMVILLVLGVAASALLFTVGWMVIDMPIKIQRWLSK